MSAKGTGLEKAVSKLDAVFESLPRDRKQALALAIYRIWPAWRQYQADAEQLMTDELAGAAWGILMSLVFVLPRGKEHTVKKLLDAFATRAPALLRFCQTVARACTDPRPQAAAALAPTETDAAESLPAKAP